MARGRLLLILAAICFLLAWLLAVEVLDPQGVWFTYRSMGALGFFLWATGHAL